MTQPAAVTRSAGDGDEVVLRLDRVTRRFGALAAVDDVSLTVHRGDRWAIIGPNGAGKTTLFRVIAGEHLPTSGTVELFGRDMSRATPHRRARLGLGRTFQITNLFPELTVEENVVVAAQAAGAGRYAFWRPVRLSGDAAERAETALQAVHLDDHRRRRTARELSHGEQRQLEIAVALAQRPRLLLLDEPAAGLSASERVLMRDVVEALPRDLSVVLIEHDMALALGLVDRVLCMDNGVTIAEGTPDEIRADERVQSVYLRS
jgi:branched-chain amino acid transport system ATP-binding protein